MKKLMTTLAVAAAFACQASAAAPTSLHNNTGVYQDTSITWEKQVVVRPAANPEKRWTQHSRWSVFYGPQPSSKNIYIEIVEETHVNHGDIEKLTGPVRGTTYTIGRLSGYKNGKAKLNVTYVRSYEYDRNGRRLSDHHLKDRENRVYDVTIPSSDAFSLKLPDGSIQHYTYEGADIGGYDEDMTAFLKKKH